MRRPGKTVVRKTKEDQNSSEMMKENFPLAGVFANTFLLIIH